MPNPITGAPGLRDLPRTEFGDPFRVQAADLDTGIVTPRALGVLVRNQSGSSIPAGSLLAVTGWSGPLTGFPNGLSLVTLASAAGRYTGATWIAQAAIPNNSNAIVAEQYMVTGVNTNAATVGDPVYLDSVTPGGYVLTNPPVAPYYQVVGRVAIKSATVGVIDLNLAAGVPFALDAWRQQMALPTIGTAAATYAQGMEIQRAGTLAAVRLKFEVALAQSDTNFVTFQVNNRGSGAGNTNWLTTSPAGVNTTKTTGGKAVTAYTDYGVTAATGPFTVAIGDWIDFTAVVTGTLANTLTGGSLSLVIQTS
jgi:hypothetical protein